MCDEAYWLAGTPSVRNVSVDSPSGLLAITFAESDGTETTALLDADEVEAVAARLKELTAELNRTGRPRVTLKQAIIEVIGRDPWA